LAAIAGPLTDAPAAVAERRSLRSSLAWLWSGALFVILTFLVSWLIARFLETGAKWQRIWATLAALGGGLLVGYVWLFQARLGLWTPVSTAIVADGCLIGYIGYSALKKRSS